MRNWARSTTNPISSVNPLSFDREFQIIYLLLVLLLVGSGLYAMRPGRKEMVRYGGIWLLIIAGLLLFYELMRRFSA